MIRNCGGWAIGAFALGWVLNRKNSCKEFCRGYCCGRQSCRQKPHCRYR